MTLELDAATVARYWVKVEKRGPDECWPWVGALGADRYGRFRACGKARRAPRIALMVAGVEVPDGLDVCHSCDNPPCVNPAHLFVGTRTQNVQDMLAKDRGVPSDRISERVRGEGNGWAVLTDDVARDIHAQYARGVPTRAIAAEHRTSRNNVWRIATGRAWRHLGLAAIARPNMLTRRRAVSA